MCQIDDEVIMGEHMFTWLSFFWGGSERTCFKITLEVLDLEASRILNIHSFFLHVRTSRFVSKALVCFSRPPKKRL